MDEAIRMLTVKCDVLIVGGSLEGSLLARALHKSGQKVVLLEKGRPQDPDMPYDRWIASPFLYTHQQWSWIQQSQAFWEKEGVLSTFEGAALAPRESISWERLKEMQESHWVKGPALDRELFPEFKLDADLGSVYLEKLPSLDIAGYVHRLWMEMQRDGADPYADTEVRQIDWEHDWPTAVTRDTIFRGKRLILTAPKLYQAQDLKQKQLWLQGQPQLEDRRPHQRPALWIHYAKAPVYLWPGPDHWGWTRLHEAEPDEQSFLEKIPGRWLNCKVDKPATYELSVDQSAMDYHPWRKDCVWLSQQGQQNWPWLPHLVQSLMDPQQTELLLAKAPELTAGPAPGGLQSLGHDVPVSLL